MIAAIHEALASICEEGLEHVWYRHKLSGETLRKGILEMGLKSSYQNKNNRLHAGIGIFHLPSDIPSLALNEYLRMRWVYLVSKSHIILTNFVIILFHKMPGKMNISSNF